MQGENLIPANEFCLHHNIEVSFINSLHEYGLIECTIINDDSFIQTAQLSDVEKLIRLHQELEINLEGIDAIIHLLKKMESMQHEMVSLKNKLRLYEANE